MDAKKLIKGRGLCSNHKPTDIPPLDAIMALDMADDLPLPTNTDGTNATCISIGGDPDDMTVGKFLQKVSIAETPMRILKFDVTVAL